MATMSNPALRQLEPVDTRPLFRPLHHKLLELLHGLDDEDWLRPTVAGAWSVRDIVCHLLDVQARNVSVQRDGHFPPPPESITGYDDLLGYLDRLNADWIRATRRLSPRLLLDWLGPLGEQAASTLEQQTLEGEATFAVDWAGVDQSRQWMHIGRQYTEYWHHHMQIRDAVGAPRLLSRYWLAPLLELSMRALPRTYQDLDAPVETTVTLTVDFEAEADPSAPADTASWTLLRAAEDWRLLAGVPEAPTTAVYLEADESWRLLYNARAPEAAKQRARVTGEPRWADPLWHTRSAMVREPGA